MDGGTREKRNDEIEEISECREATLRIPQTCDMLSLRNTTTRSVSWSSVSDRIGG